MTATTSKLPRFHEWLQVRDPEMFNEGGWDTLKQVGKGLLGAGVIGTGLWGASHLLPSGGSSPAPIQPQRQMVSTNTGMPSGASKRVEPPKDIGNRSVTVDDNDSSDPTPASIGKTIRLKGGHSGYADVRATLSRPGPNQWVFDIKGEIEARSAIKQTRAIVQDELGARTPAGIQAQITPTDDGMRVSLTFAK
jgi:hypothetical protein